jgi:hypothetical protein
MKRIISILITTVALLSFVLPASASNTNPSGHPYFSILTVVTGQTVTIQAYNFPAHDTFRVTLGTYGGYGIGGVVVGFSDTGDGGSFVATYSIPSTLAGLDKIAIRLQSPSSGYYAYNWFYNNPVSSPSTTPIPGYSGYPYFFIDSVIQDQSVTIQAYNFPHNDTFTVTMGSYGNYGIGGTVVGSTSTGGSGSFTATYNIPASLAGSQRIAIRLQSPNSGYFAYNWFYNNNASATGTPNPTTTPAPPGYSGYPYFSITAVTRDQTVTIQASNFPPNETFTITMGAYGSYGIGGTVVGSTSTGGGGSFAATYNIPSSLAGSYRIAIRLQSSTSGYFAYNWFYNNNAP